MSGGARGRVRVRFAPDPRADLNVAGARIALVNWLFARHHQGDMILRIEDRDPSRPSHEGAQQVMDHLRWLGLAWDEGPDVGGDHAPYRQSERTQHYRTFLSRLQEADRVYPCYCTPEELAARNRAARRDGKAPRYSSFCRRLSPERRAELTARGIKPALRFKAPLTGHTPVSDMIRGLVLIDNRQLDDFVILRQDGAFTYNFCCVADDHLMNISHVIRGEEHVLNSPRQLWLYEALGLDPPTFVHLGPMTEPDGSHLRRGHGGSSVSELRRRGLLAPVLVQFLAGLDGLEARPGADLADVARKFSPAKLRQGAVPYARKLLYTQNARHLRSLSDHDLASLARPYLEQAGVWPRPGRDDKWLQDAIGLIREEVVLLSDVPQYLAPLLDPTHAIGDRRLDQLVDTASACQVLKAWIETLSNAGAVESWDLRALGQDIRKELGVQIRDVFMPLRVALTGRVSGADLHTVARLLGRGQVIERLLTAHRQFV